MMEALALLPKAELHAHLNGCVPPSLFRDLLIEQGVVESENIVVSRDLMNLEPAKGGLRAYFRPWKLIRQLDIGRETLTRMVNAAVGHLRDDNIRYAELRHSVIHVAARNGHPAIDVLGWLLDALDEASEHHGVDSRLIVSLVRHELLHERMGELMEALRVRKDHARLVGIDLTGDEERPLDPTWKSLLAQARDECELGVTIHAGETGSVENIKWAISECLASRIGHGLAAAHDDSALALIRERNVCIEVCMTSNYLTRHVPEPANHPVSTFLDWDLPFVICSDNPQMHGKGLTAEYQLFEELFSRRDVLDAMYDRQQLYSFMDDRA